jgi:CubicO group peptidase (beta-lactamase class C family)
MRLARLKPGGLACGVICAATRIGWEICADVRINPTCRTAVVIRMPQPFRLAYQLLCFVFVTTVAVSRSARAADETYFPPPDAQGGWRTPANPAEVREKAGLDPKALELAYEFTTHCSKHGGLLVVRHGYLAFERYFGRAYRDGLPDMASTGKAFTSIACGIMLNEFHDKIPDGLNTKVFTDRFLPEAFPLDDPRKANITLGQLLCMTAGYNGEGGSPGAVVNGSVVALKSVQGQDIKNLDAVSIQAPLWAEPGAGYSYASHSPHVASIVLR